MKLKTSPGPEFSEPEVRFLKQLQQHPELQARIQSILDLAHAEEGPLKTADEVEALLIQELRQLGNTSMNHWAAQAEARVSAELRQQDQTVRSRKKKR